MSNSNVEEIGISKCKKRKKNLPLPIVVRASRTTRSQASKSVETQSADPCINEDCFLIFEQTTNNLPEPVFCPPPNEQTLCSPLNAPAMPIMPENTQRRIFHQENSAVYQISEHHQHNNSPENPVGNGSLSVPIVEYLHHRSESSKVKPTPVEREMLCWMKKVNCTLGEQSKLLANALAPLTFTSEVPRQYDFPALPIKNDDEMQQWEEYLSTKTNFSKALKYFSIKGGSNPNTVTRRILKSIITTELACFYNWAGRGGKLPFKDLITRRLITCAVRENKTAKIPSQRVVEDAIKNWLKHCPLRLKYGKKE